MQRTKEIKYIHCPADPSRPRLDWNICQNRLNKGQCKAKNFAVCWKGKESGNMGDIICALIKELERAESIHPEWPDDPIHAAAILAEETGELVQAANDFYYAGGDAKRMETEAVQTGAMAIRFLLHLHEYKRRNGK